MGYEMTEQIFRVVQSTGDSLNQYQHVSVTGEPPELGQKIILTNINTGKKKIFEVQYKSKFKSYYTLKNRNNTIVLKLIGDK